MQLQTLGAENSALSGLRFWRSRRVVFGAVGLRFLAPSRRALALSGLALSGLGLSGSRSRGSQLLPDGRAPVRGVIGLPVRGVAVSVRAT